jgi:ABC-2 type transport system ATP-binding protein
MIIDHGQLLYDGKLDLLWERFVDNRNLIGDFAGNYGIISIDGAEIINRQGNRIAFQFTSQEISASELTNQLSAQFLIRDLKVGEPDIETTIPRIYFD